MPPSKNISFAELSKYFHLPINQVAKEVGVCATILKKICRKNGIPRWPHRKIKSLDKMIANLEMNVEKIVDDKNSFEREDMQKEIELLKEKRRQIINHPDILVSKVTHDSKSLSIAKMKRNFHLRARPPYPGPTYSYVDSDDDFEDDDYEDEEQGEDIPEETACALKQLSTVAAAEVKTGMPMTIASSSIPFHSPSSQSSNPNSPSHSPSLASPHRTHHLQSASMSHISSPRMPEVIAAQRSQEVPVVFNSFCLPPPIGKSNVPLSSSSAQFDYCSQLPVFKFAPEQQKTIADSPQQLARRHLAPISALLNSTDDSPPSSLSFPDWFRDERARVLGTEAPRSKLSAVV